MPKLSIYRVNCPPRCKVKRMRLTNSPPALKIIFILISSSSGSVFAKLMKNKKIIKILNNKNKISLTKTILTYLTAIAINKQDP